MRNKWWITDQYIYLMWSIISSADKGYEITAYEGLYLEMMIEMMNCHLIKNDHFFYRSHANNYQDNIFFTSINASLMPVTSFKL